MKQMCATWDIKYNAGRLVRRHRRFVNGRWDDSYLGKRLSLINAGAQLFRKLNRLLVNELLSVVGGFYRRSISSFISIEYSSDYSLLDIMVKTDLFSDNGATHIVAYISSQKSPHRPYQAESHSRRLKKYASKMLGPGDSAKYVVVAVGGATPGALEVYRRHNIMVVRNPREIPRIFVEFMKKRLTKLIDKLRGVKIYGKVSLLVYGFAKIIEYMTGKKQLDTITEITLVETIFGQPKTIF